MFVKKLLSVVGLLFLGSQIISVKGEGVCAPTLNGDTCTPAECEAGDADKLFLVINKSDSESYIVEVKKTGLNPEDPMECNKITTAANYCTTAGGNVMNTIDGFCEDGCVGTQPTYSCKAGGICTKDVDPRTCQRTTCKYDGEGFSGCANGDYLIVEETPGVGGAPATVVGLIEKEGAEEAGNDVKLYKCTGEPAVKCGKVSDEDIEVGYYKNAGSITSPYIKCDSNGCLPVNLSKEEEEDICDGSNNGVLFFNNVVKICLDSGKSLPLDGEFTGKYFMSMKEANLFGEGLNADLYAALDVTDKEIHILKEKDLENEGSTLEMYRYANTNNKIFGKTEKSKLCIVSNDVVNLN